MKYLISYDICSDNNRKLIAKELDALGFRVQKSVFEVFLSPVQLDLWIEKVSPWVDEISDSIRIYPLCHLDDSKSKILGHGNKIEEQDFMIC